MIRQIIGMLITGGAIGCASTPPPADRELLARFREVCIDVAPVLGVGYVDCGTFAPVRGKHIDQRKVALKCVLQAQRQRRAFIYHFVEYSFPDVGIDHVVVVGEHGERLLRQRGDFGDEYIDFVGACDALSVRQDGYPDHAGCRYDAPLIERLKLPPRADDPTKCDLARFSN